MNYIHHICLTVSDAKKSINFYKKVLDWKVIEEKEDYAYFVSDSKEYPATKCMLVVGESRDGRIPNDKFNRNRIGLDHFAFNVETREELKGIEKRLKSAGIEIETGGITDDDFGGIALFCYDPDGMKVEFHLNSK